MATFRRASQERINAFEVDEEVLFRHYFEGDEVFDRLRRYYNNQQYRFEVPADEFEEIQSFLRDHDYAISLVESIDPFAVVVRKYTDHPDQIFKRSVAQRTVDGHNCFLLADREAVERVVQGGARRLAETEFANPFTEG